MENFSLCIWIFHAFLIATKSKIILHHFVIFQFTDHPAIQDVCKFETIFDPSPPPYLNGSLWDKEEEIDPPNR